MKYAQYSNGESNSYSKIGFIVKLAAAVSLFSMLVISSAHAQQYKKITRVGTSQSVCTGGAETIPELQAFFASNPGAIRDILNDSGWTGSNEALLAAVASGNIREVNYPRGTRLAWMGAKVNGEYIAHRYREWDGATSLEAFQVNVSSGCQVYEIAIPKACCNVSLVAVRADNSAQCRPPAPAPVVRAPVPVPAPAPVPEVSPLALVPFIGLFAGSETRPRFEPIWNADQKDSSGLAGIRAGLSREINSKTSVFTQLSFYDRQGINEFNEFSEDNFAIDIGLDRKITERTFIGGGIGLWDVDDSEFREESLFGHIGGDIGASNFQWILEGRIFDSDSELDSISDNKLISAGVRYLVK